ncbi:hypothetical protein AAFF_G00307050 [Aldrovandia affinis]|uniref:Uncharacterized protein n=1 Tax=Aldrovandia affinis TaxID=143900 RepID=A0AAD7R888_9TELE|nr:hypothetical protein AAFF_G00307050 [Aldrovandia affinis]
MALVKAKEFNQAGHVVKWLMKHNFHNRGYESRPPSLRYRLWLLYVMEVSDVKDVNLQVSLDVAGRSKP